MAALRRPVRTPARRRRRCRHGGRCRDRRPPVRATCTAATPTVKPSCVSRESAAAVPPAATARRDAEIGDHRRITTHQHIVRLDVAMNDAVFVRVGTGARDVEQDATASRERQGAARFQPGASDSPSTNGMIQVRHVVDRARCEDRNDVRMLERGGEQRFSCGTVRWRARRPLRRQHLDDDSPVEREIAAPRTRATSRRRGARPRSDRPIPGPRRACCARNRSRTAAHARVTASFNRRPTAWRGCSLSAPDVQHVPVTQRSRRPSCSTPHRRGSVHRPGDRGDQRRWQRRSRRARRSNRAALAPRRQPPSSGRTE